MPINNRSSPAASTGRSSPGEPSVLVPQEDKVPLGREWDWRPRQTPAPTHTSMGSLCQANPACLWPPPGWTDPCSLAEGGAKPQGAGLGLREPRSGLLAPGSRGPREGAAP